MSNTTLTDGSPVTPDHREIDPATGQQKGYVVLSAEERANFDAAGALQLRARVRHGHNDGPGIGRDLRTRPLLLQRHFLRRLPRSLPSRREGEFRWDGTGDKVGTEAERGSSAAAR